MTTKTDTEQERAAFEAWITAPPYEKPVNLNPDSSGFPGQYRAYEVQLAWEAYQAGRAAMQSQDREDAARLDWLDSMSARLNQHYGTQYQWELAVSPNIVRLMFGAGGNGHVAAIDLNDSAANGVPSCREAIDRARRAEGGGE